jgi:hypothetical protein
LQGFAGPQDCPAVYLIEFEHVAGDDHELALSVAGDLPQATNRLKS